MDRQAGQEFRGWAVASRGRLRRTAFLLSGDWFLADDLVQDTLIRIYRAWPRIERTADISRYAQRVLLNLYLDYRRRPGRREQPTDQMPDHRYAPPPDTTDIDAAIRVGHRQQQHRRALLSSAAVIAVATIAVAAALPSIHRSPASPGASPAVTSAPITASDGTKVTNPHQLFGSWQTIQLDGKDVRAVRDGGGQPLGVRFYLFDTKLWWVANDVTNAHAGFYSVSTSGQFRANSTFVSAVGPGRDREQYLRNPEAVQEATEARRVAATPTDPPELLLLAQAKIVAVYALITPIVGTSTGHK